MCKAERVVVLCKLKLVMMADITTRFSRGASLYSSFLNKKIIKNSVVNLEGDLERLNSKNTWMI